MGQRTFTIELKVDYADRNKDEEIKKACIAAGVHLFATAQLLSDIPRTTDIAVYTDDNFIPRKQILAQEDIIRTGNAALPSTQEADGNSAEDLAAVIGDL
jgi:hypothetical protein